jgi:multidrug transporter EmrE-like cation transporter
MTWIGYLALATAVAANVSANVALRSAVRAIEPGSPLQIALQLAATPLAWLGALCLGILLGSFLLAIRFLPLGLSYAIVTSSVIMLLTLFDALVAGASLGPARIAGLGAILVGVLLLTSVRPV